MTPTFEAASARDLGAIRALLLTGALPVEDVERHVAQFLLAKWDGATIGTVAVEYAGEAGLLRSLCVVPKYRGQAVGTRLLSAIEELVASRRVRELYLLTTSSAAFFERHGFSPTSRAAAPPGIRGTAQFRELCPSTAIFMHKLLPGSSSPARTK